MGNSIRVAICDDNEAMLQMIGDTVADCEQIDVVGAAKDGEEAVRVILEEKPDVVLLDLVMPKLDGLSVMDTVAAACADRGIKKPCYIIISAAGNELTVNGAISRGAAYFIMKPFNGPALIDRILSIFNDKGNAAAFEADKDTACFGKITALLKSLGVSIKMAGFKYLRDAIEIAIDNPEAGSAITKSIYPDVATRHGTSPGNVERNIRYVIETTWSNLPGTQFEGAAKLIFKNIGKKPTNSEFILNCANWIANL